jgi:hypothetical protein
MSENENENENTEQEFTYNDLAMMIGYRMINLIGIMSQLGLTTLPHFIKTYLDPSQTDDPYQRDFERWLKWALAPKNSAEREHLYPTDLVSICQATLTPLSLPEPETLSAPCIECGKRLTADEIYYGHDCEV